MTTGDIVGTIVLSVLLGPLFLFALGLLYYTLFQFVRTELRWRRWNR